VHEAGSAAKLAPAYAASAWDRAVSRFRALLAGGDPESAWQARRLVDFPCRAGLHGGGGGLEAGGKGTVSMLTGKVCVVNGAARR